MVRRYSAVCRLDGRRLSFGLRGFGCGAAEASQRCRRKPPPAASLSLCRSAFLFLLLRAPDLLRSGTVLSIAAVLRLWLGAVVIRGSRSIARALRRKSFCQKHHGVRAGLAVFRDVEI